MHGCDVYESITGSECIVLRNLIANRDCQRVKERRPVRTHPPGLAAGQKMFHDVPQITRYTQRMSLRTFESRRVWAKKKTRKATRTPGRMGALADIPIGAHRSAIRLHNLHLLTSSPPIRRAYYQPQTNGNGTHQADSPQIHWRQEAAQSGFGNKGC